MGRRPREEEECGIYHVIQRGNNREFVFDDNRDKKYMIGQLMLLSRRGCIVYGYVIMGNHYHLVLKTGGELLQTVMHRLNLRYSKYYNKEHERSGHVFQGRYKAIPVRDEKYILALLRYVHQNPVKAGVCKRVEEYKWSSEQYYQERMNGWIDTDLVLGMLSADRISAIKKYNEFMSEQETADYENIKVIGGTLVNRPEKERIKKIIKRKSLDEILMATGVSEGEFNLIKNRSRRRDLTEYKLKFAIEALQMNYTIKEIGENIKVSDVAIIQMLRRNTNENDLIS
ncbi:MAG: transposase [Actinobacteria bacterium]|nr:transposase [Actinomycetota bacterium]